MTSNLQLISFSVSFIFGIVFALLTILNFKIVNNSLKFIQNIITFIFVMDMIIIYIIIMYKLNHGYFHLYFIIMTIIGFFVGIFVHTKYLSKIDVKRHFYQLKK